MINKIISMFIFVVLMLLVIVIYDKFLKPTIVPLPDTTVKVIHDLSAIDANRTKRVEKNKEKISNSRRGFYE